ncbi:MAG TPA: hypothetical protein VF220_01505 [Nitrososphaeraceae archaeon]
MELLPAVTKEQRSKMKIHRRIDPKIVDQIMQVIEQCRDAELPEQDAMFAEYKIVPNATRLEHALAHNPIYTGYKGTTKEIRQIKYDLMQVHNAEIRLFNKSLKALDMEIIGVSYDFQDVNGNDFRMVFDELAIGVNAIRAGEKCDAYINGYKDKKKRLIKMGNDETLKTQHDAKLRAIRRLLNKGKGKN